jgi:hypothetical protein
MMLLIPLVGVFGATAAANADDSNDDAMKYSFYKVASSTTAFFSTIQEPGNNKSFSAPWTTMLADPGSAGSLLGYADPDFTSVSGWLASKLSGSSDAIGYETLLVRDAGDSGNYSSSKYQGMVDYAYFGAALKGMGLDGTSTGLSLGFMNWISGGIVMLLFIFGGAVDFVFNSFISLLGMLNPFKLFYLGVQAISPELANGMVGNSDNTNVGPLSGLVSWIGGWYQALHDLSWTVLVPVFVAVLIISLLLFKKVDKGGAFKKIVIRLLFIGIGLPLLGSMYTGMIDSMASASTSGNAGSARVVMSTYVDFENWAVKSRLAIPSKAIIEWDSSSAQPSGKAQSNVRNTALAINNQTHGLGLNQILTSGSYDASWANQIMEGKTTDATTSANIFAKTVDMLVRYMQGSQISSASFETISKGDLTQSTFYYEHGNDTVKSWFEDLTKKADDLNKDDATPGSNPLVAVQSGTGLRADGTGTRTFSSTTSGCSFTGTTIVGADGAPRACNLSPLAMYNYLNTDFGPTSMRMYSSSNVASEATRSIHNSVDQVGTGAMSFLYWFNAVVLLGSFVLIGLGYAFALLFASIRRSFQIITAVPFATLGALAAIAKVVVYSVALVLEVVVTIFVYKIVQEFLTSLPQIIEMPFASVLSNGATGPLAGFVAFLISGWGFGLVVTLLSILGVVGFTVLALRVRKVLVKAVEEAVTKLVEKFMDTPVGVPGGGKLAPALAGGMAAGAGAAAANRMMGHGGGKSPVGSPLPGNHGGPDGITTEGGTVPTGPVPDGGGDGQLELTGKIAGADGNGDPGTSVGGSLPGGPSSQDAAKEVALGRQVEANGLSKRDEIRAPQVGDDALSSASDSVDKSAAGYAAADKKQLQAGTEGAQALGHGAVAAGRGVAGDYAGAAESGGKAIEHGGAAAAAGHRAKQLEADAGRSSLDKPNQRHAQQAAKAQQVSRAGTAISRAGGMAGGSKAATSVGPVKTKQGSPQTAKKVQPAPPKKQSVPTAPQPATSKPVPRSPKPVVQKAETVPTTSKPAPQRAPRAPRPSRPAPQAPRPATKSSPRDEERSGK